MEGTTHVHRVYKKAYPRKREQRIKDQILKLRTSTESIKEPDVS